VRWRKGTVTEFAGDVESMRRLPLPRHNVVIRIFEATSTFHTHNSKLKRGCNFVSLQKLSTENMTHQVCDLSRTVPPVLMCACYQLLRHFLPCPLLVKCSSYCDTHSTAFRIGRAGVCRELNAVLTRLFNPRNKTPVAWWNKNCAGHSTLRTA